MAPGSESAEREHLRAVQNHTRALRRPLTDDDIVDALRHVASWRADPSYSALSTSVRADIDKNMQEQQDLLRAWIRELNLVPEPDRDPVTGLENDAVQARRTVVDPDLGDIPVSLREAQVTAYLDASAEERAAASAYAEYGSARSEADWRVTQMTAEMPRTMALEFIRFASREDSTAGRALMDFWENGELRDLLSRYVNGVR